MPVQTISNINVCKCKTDEDVFVWMSQTPDMVWQVSVEGVNMD